jgi:Fe2+ transport system protein B
MLRSTGKMPGSLQHSSGTPVALAGTADPWPVMTSVQVYTFAMFGLPFVPCVPTIATRSCQPGAGIALLTSVHAVFLGLVIGAIINLLAK